MESISNIKSDRDLQHKLSKILEIIKEFEIYQYLLKIEIINRLLNYLNLKNKNKLDFSIKLDNKNKLDLVCVTGH